MEKTGLENVFIYGSVYGVLILFLFGSQVFLFVCLLAFLFFLFTCFCLTGLMTQWSHLQSQISEETLQTNNHVSALPCYICFSD